ncbi:MAG: hypothetical protein KF789_10145 [Bdellovibrionaceae bacterium]|nr:hypothetical protein [Pseudobdellovibrionaceae bacterium]
MSVPLQGLLDLNAQASLLKTQQALAVAALTTAVAAANPPAIAKAAARVERIRAKQFALDRAQQALLKTAKLILAQTQFKAHASVQKTPIGFLRSVATPPSLAHVAVRPTTPGPAPVYVLEDNFKERQALVQKWQSAYVLKGPLARFLKAKGSFQSRCALTLIKQENRWIAEIIEDKSSSKPSSSVFF